MPPDVAPSAERKQSIIDAAKKIRSGDIDGGLALFVDRIGGPGTWAKRPAASKQQRRDNAGTLIGQLEEARTPFSRTDAEAIQARTLLIGGADTKGMLPIVLKALAGAIDGAESVLIPNASHSMFEAAPQAFCKIVIDFLDTPTD